LTIENAKISAVLEAAGTIVVPSRQRAVALRLAYARARIRAGVSAWLSCDILPWSAWLARCAAQSRFGPLRSLRPLGAAEEWLLWREAAVEACEGSEVLRAASLGEALRRSCSLERDWGLGAAATPTAESAVLRRARDGFLRRCRELGAYALSDWALTLRDLRLEGPAPLFAGFDGLGPALGARLRALGGQFTASLEHPTEASAEVIAALDRGDEFHRAAAWCRQALERDPSARLLVVVPQLATVRAVALQAFEHTLHGAELLGAPGAPLYAIEGGQNLSEFPMVRAALGLLALASGPVEFALLAPLLRSPYLDCGPLPQRLALELALRDRNVQAASLGELIELARAQPGTVGSMLPAAFAALSLPPAPRGGQDAASWARRYAAVLESGGWPGPNPLGSEEQQQRDRFRELLGEFALTGASGALLSAAAALDLLRALALRTAFDPATGDVPVTLTDAIDDPAVVYDGIWVAGLDADSWSPPARPDPFLPVAAQRAAGMAIASAEGQRRRALRAMQVWARCARHWVLSWPQQDGEVALQASSLLSAAVGAPTAAAPDRLVAALRSRGSRERRPADRALSWAPGRRLPGGTRALQLQSHCPFRAVAELRLGAVPVPEPRPGLDPRERGQILHRALELVWRSLGDSHSLRARAALPGELDRVARVAGAQALQEGLAARARPLAPALLDNEQQRIQRLLARLLEQDQQRAAVSDFSAVRLEDTEERALSGQAIRIRMDRVDRLDDGSLIVIDYKSGAAQSFSPLDGRPRQPQLLAYAVLANPMQAGDVLSGAAAVAGVAAVYLNPDEVRWRGAAADRAVLPQLPRGRGPVAPWPELLAQWRRLIERLVDDFAAGEAAVDPLPEACRNCHLPALCRIGSARLAEAEEFDAEAATQTDEAVGANDAAGAHGEP